MYDDLFDDPEDNELVDLDTDEGMVYGTGTDVDPFCDNGFGDSEGLCIANLYGCHFEGCSRATPIG